MEKTIALLPGDGIGPEVMAEARKVLVKVEGVFGHKFTLMEALVGGAAFDETDTPLPDHTLNICTEADAILFGSVGGPKWDAVEPEKRPEKGLLQLRKHFDLFANLRPAKIFRGLESASPLRPEISGNGFDILTVRELTGGIYFGEKGSDATSAWDVMKYSVPEIERIARIAFEAAKKRKKRVCSVDKSNVLSTSILWRKTVSRVQQKEFPEISLEHLYIDNATMQLLVRPQDFDVIVTGNMFGDILSDEVAQISGSIGMLPSASLNADNFGMYEPAGGSAPNIAGKNIANPLAQILSLAMLLKYSFVLDTESAAIEKAVQEVLDDGLRTADIWTKGGKKVGTKEMGDAVTSRIG